MEYNVLTRSPLYPNKPYRVHTSHETLWEAMAVASRLEKNTELDVCVEIPDNQVIRVPFNVLALEA